jgi:hypothetical protein
VDGKVINRELVWRNAERDLAEGGTGILLNIRTEFYVGCPQLLQVNAGISSNNGEYGRRDPSRWPHGTLYPQKLAITSPTSGGRSVGIIRLRTQTMEFVCLFVCLVFVWSGIWISRESARNIIKNCPIPSFKGMLTGARGSMVGWGTRRLQAERSLARFPVRPLDFSVYAIPPAALWPWALHPFTDMSTRNPPGAKGTSTT